MQMCRSMDGGVKVDKVGSVTYFGEFSRAKQFIVCTGLSFNLQKRKSAAMIAFTE